MQPLVVDLKWNICISACHVCFTPPFQWLWADRVSRQFQAGGKQLSNSDSLFERLLDQRRDWSLLWVGKFPLLNKNCLTSWSRQHWWTYFQYKDDCETTKNITASWASTEISHARQKIRLDAKCMSFLSSYGIFNSTSRWFCFTAEPKEFQLSTLIRELSVGGAKCLPFIFNKWKPSFETVNIG